MKKTIAILLVSLLALSLFAACGSGDTDGGAATPVPAATPDPGNDNDGNGDNNGNGGEDNGGDVINAPERGDPEKTDFAIGHLNSTAHLLAFVAAEEGYFAEEGLTVTLHQFASSGELVAGLEGGQLDVSLIGSVPTITFQSNERDVTIFGGAMTNGHGLVIKSDLVPDGFERGDVTILKGRNVAVPVNSIQDFQLLYLLNKAGIEIGTGADEVNIEYFPSQTDAYNALAGNQIDASSVYSPFASVAEAEGHTVVFYSSEVEDFYNQPCCRQVALTSALSEYPNAYVAFERAIIRAYKFTQENREDTVFHIAKYITIDLEQIDFEVYGGHAKSIPDPDRLATATLKEGVVEFGYTDGRDYDIYSLYNVEIYETALNQLLAENPDDSIYQELKTRFESAN